MDLQSFKIRQVIFEIRYDTAYLLWDRAGAITAAISKLWPGCRLTDGKPNQQTMEWDAGSIQTGVELSIIVMNQPKTISQYAELIQETVNLWVSMLEINKFNRIGTRIMFTKAFDTAEQADSAVVALNLVKVPVAPIFNHKCAPTGMELKMIWGDDVSQTQVAIKPEHITLEIPGLPDRPAEKRKETTHVLLLDIDRAMKGPVQLSKFRAIDWLDGVRHLLSRDVKRVLEAK